MRNRRIDQTCAFLLMLVGLGHSASVFYFFRPLIPPGEVGLEREAFYGWIASGIMVFATGLINWLRLECRGTPPAILKACLLLTAMVAAMAVLLATFGVAYLLPARVLLVIIVFYELWASLLALLQARPAP